MNGPIEIAGRADGMIATAILFIVLSGVAVGLRMFSRTMVKMCFGADDWTIILALLLFYIVEGLEIYGEQSCIDGEWCINIHRHITSQK